MFLISFSRDASNEYINSFCETYVAIIVLHMYCYYKYSVVLPRGAVGWSAVCDCGIS